MQIRIILRFHLTPGRMAHSKKITNAGKDMGKEELLLANRGVLTGAAIMEISPKVP